MFEEEFRRRQIFSVVWLHADHWEPWGDRIDERAARKIEEFAKQIARFRFARKMTLFHLAAPDYRLLDAPRSDVLAAPGDRLEFLPRSAAETAVARSALGDLTARVPVEFQLHIHHEQFTDSDRDWNNIHAALKRCTTPELDEVRFRYLVQLSLDILRHDTGLAFPSWAFVHGNWALNASDPEVCKIESEVQILHEMGCWGDFSFPAGRGHCDPAILEAPYTISPVRGPRCYDLPAADPRPVAAGAENFGPGRFLIWTSKANAMLCSLDIATPFDRKRLHNRENIVGGWLRDCPVIDGTLYIKTHAHSMNAAYFDDGRSVPLCDPDVVSIFGLLELACEKAGVELRACTVGEVLERLRRLDAGANAEPAPEERESLIVAAGEAAAVATLSRDDADEALEKLALDGLTAWMTCDPVRKAAIGDYYVDKIARRRLFVPHDRAISVYCAAKFAVETQFVELGSGLGELALLFSRRGLRLFGLEAEKARSEAASNILEILRPHLPTAGPETVRLGRFPEVMVPEYSLRATRVFVCGHVTNSYLLDKFDDVLTALQDFDHLVIDVSTFGRRRDEADLAMLIAAILAKGFVEVARVFSDDVADIRHFRRRLAVTAPQPARRTVAAPPVRRLEAVCEGVLGVIGSSYCGSTLLNMMIDSHPEIAGAGELKFLFRKEGNTCAFCGEDCVVWTKERRAAVTPDNIFDLSTSSYGKRLVCDSSKTWTHFIDVRAALVRPPSSLILLVKHPVRHVSSFLEKARRFENMAAQNDIDVVMKTLLDGYDSAMTKLRIDHIVRYEDFAVEPQVVLTPILASLGLAYSPEMDRWFDKPHHHIGGNAGPRFQSARHIKPVGDFLEKKYREEGIFLDDSYNQILSVEEIGRITSHPMAIEMCRRFGYDPHP